MRGLARVALAAGVKIFTLTEVLTARDTGSRLRIGTVKGSVNAEWVIIAIDAYGKGPWSQVRQEQIHLPYSKLATRSLPDNLRTSILPERQGTWDTREVLSSFRFDRTPGVRQHWRS
ncbi:FAD-dependent oxidoreductase [Bradyrhizobium ivorense]|uniref:FAD-dependent oxidoreductase n=1 Tax=Bradyrhizobium ivorense TaxID=2511166 RepID=UPI001FCE6785|nr:FAD-dependent oxidoreductase [Bradyrhizobium ivorense]